MARMQVNAPLLSAFEPYFCQMRIRTCLAKARSSSRPVVVTGFQAGGGSVALSSVIVMPSVVALVLDPGESISLLADEDEPGSRKHPFEPEPALRVGGRRDRPGSVAAVEHFRADDRMSIGADDPAGEMSVGA